MEKICYCNNVTFQDMVTSYQAGNTSLGVIIEDTGAMKDSNCAVNNPKKHCCYNDLVAAYQKIIEEY